LARFGANVVTLAAAGMELPQYVVERMESDYGYSLSPLVARELGAVVTATDALYLTPKQPHQLALFTQLDSTIQSRLSTMASQLRYDAFYMTRKQKERLKEGAQGGSYPTIGDDFLKARRFKDTVVMHPLPRVDELSPELDRDKRAGAHGFVEILVRRHPGKGLQAGQPRLFVSKPGRTWSSLHQRELRNRH
jgi:hypothetical protein